MPTIALEGVGASIAFATSAFAADIYSISLPERTREKIDTTHLGSTVVKTAKPGKLIDPGEIQVEIDHDPAAARLVKQPPEQITVHYPLRGSQTVSDQIEFTGFVTSEGGESFEVGKALRTKLTITVTSDYAFTAGH